MSNDPKHAPKAKKHGPESEGYSPLYAKVDGPSLRIWLSDTDDLVVGQGGDQPTLTQTPRNPLKADAA